MVSREEEQRKTNMVVEHLVDMGVHHDTFVIGGGHEFIPVAQVLEPIVQHHHEVTFLLSRQRISVDNVSSALNVTKNMPDPPDEIVGIVIILQKGQPFLF